MFVQQHQPVDGGKGKRRMMAMILMQLLRKNEHVLLPLPVPIRVYHRKPYYKEEYSIPYVKEGYGNNGGIYNGLDLNLGHGNYGGIDGGLTPTNGHHGNANSIRTESYSGGYGSEVVPEYDNSNVAPYDGNGVHPEHSDKYHEYGGSGY